MYVNSLLRVIHIHGLLLVLFRCSTRMFVVLRTSLIWKDQYRPKGERKELRPASDDTSRPRRTLHRTKHDKLLPATWLSAAPAYLDFTLYTVKCGFVIGVMDAISHLRTIVVDAVPICKDFLVELCLLSSGGVRIHKAAIRIRDLPSFYALRFSALTNLIHRQPVRSVRLRGSGVPVES